jgi:hypothetical protein
MKITFIFFLIFLFCINVSAQKNPEPKLAFGSAYLNYKTVKNAFQVNASLQLNNQKLYFFSLGYQYLLASTFKEDQRNIVASVYNFNTLLQQTAISGQIGKKIIDNKIRINVLTGIGLCFTNATFVNNIYNKEIFPNNPTVLVSESTYRKTIQPASISSINTSISLNRFSPGFSLQYQLQKEFNSFTPSIFLSYKL